MKLSNRQAFLLQALFLATAVNAPESDFCVPANEGEWSEEYVVLQEMNILDNQGLLTPYGRHRAHQAQSEGVNFKKLAQRNPNMAIAMMREGFTVVQQLAANNQEFSANTYKLFEEMSAELGYICAPVDVVQHTEG